MPVHTPLHLTQVKSASSWDEGLIKQYLRQLPEPSVPHNAQIWAAKVVLIKIRLRELRLVEELAAPRIVPAIRSQITAMLLARNLSTWLAFPINNLPVEILIHIFRFVVYSQTNPYDGIRQRMYLTWVCRHWRTIAIADQIPWSFVWYRGRAPWPLAELFLERAGTAPLDIVVEDRSKIPDDQEPPPSLTVEDVDYLMDELSLRIGQIRSLELFVQGYFPTIRIMFWLCACGIPHTMTRFKVYRGLTPFLWELRDSRDIQQRCMIPLCGGNVPKLEELHLDGVGIDWQIFPARNLRSIDLRRIGWDFSPSPERWIAMLQGCPNLYKLVLTATGPRWDDTGIRRVHLPNLRDFALGNVSLQYAQYIFDFMDAPRLMKLTYDTMKSEDYGPLLDVATTFREMKVLAIQGMNFHPTQQNLCRIVKLLEGMSNLRFLKIGDATRQFLDAFMEDPREYREEDPVNESPHANAPLSVLCPDLQYLLVLEQEPDSLIRFLRGRRALGVPFSAAYLDVRFYATLSDEQVKAMRAELTNELFTIRGVSPGPAEEEIDKEIAATVQVV
ncbi:hypothetical protein BKA93DRAFT_186469 [Sparassis latifolia]|uniref:Uncharacterized protein n=1 Tax=Sparassis crispa TaxID=139825 RepID=A0A401G6G7_9APHY|nr:hypothetical protein SCP_0106440 [Sparassis crispa]GBE77762.1 hypothetical protein SCP_0106440 [Sparassis crispa]